MRGGGGAREEIDASYVCQLWLNWIQLGHAQKETRSIWSRMFLIEYMQIRRL